MGSHRQAGHGAACGAAETDDDRVAITLIGYENNNCHLPVPTASPDDPANYMVSRTKGYYCGDLPLPDAWRINTQEFADAGLKAGLESESTRYSLKVDYSFDNGWLLTSSTGYNEQERYSAFDQSYDGVHDFVLASGFRIPGALATFSFVRSRTSPRDSEQAATRARTWQVSSVSTTTKSKASRAGAAPSLPRSRCRTTQVTRRKTKPSTASSAGTSTTGGPPRWRPAMPRTT